MKAIVDYKLLAKQKEELVGLVMDNKSLTEEQVSALDGIIGLLDVMLDEHEESPANEIYKFPRKCDITGKGMWEGYCFGDGEHYAMDKPSAEKLAKRYGYDTLEEAFEDGAYYWTEWEELDEDEWYESEYQDGRDALGPFIIGD